MDISVFQQPKKGNYYCGDSYYYAETEDGFICALADGLGSGEFAKESSQAVMDVIKTNTKSSIEHIIKQCTQQLAGKRGAVLGILKVDFQEMNYSFSSIGNIGMMTISDESVKNRNIPNAGYLGGYPKPFKILRDKISDKMVFVMFSDGVNSLDLSSRFFLGKDVDKITESFSHYFSPIPSDDTTLIVMKYNA
nr:indirect negative regulator of sigma-B activity [Paraliobacillus ryukyuensis]